MLDHTSRLRATGPGVRRMGRRAVLGGTVAAAAAGLAARSGGPIPAAAQDASPSPRPP